MLNRFLLSAPLLLCAAAAAPGVADEAATDGAADGAPAITDCQIGFHGLYKLGCWTPVAATVEGAEGLESPRLEVVAPDGDGSPAVVTVEIDANGSSMVVRTLTRVGRKDAKLRVRLLDGERLVDQWTSGADPDNPVRALPATATLRVETGASRRLDTQGQHVVRMRPDELPDAPLAYDGVSTLTIASGEKGDDAAYPRPVVDAVHDWVGQGGRLLLVCGANAQRLIGADGAFADLAPGKLKEIVQLPGVGVIEDYADSDHAIDAPQGLSAARLQEVVGLIDLHAGGRATEMPLVVRSQYGFGEVTYVGFDLDSPVLTEWGGFDRVMSLLFRSESAEQMAKDSASGQMVVRAFNDLAGALHVRLGRSFAGVRTITMLSLVAAVAIYLALLGPGAWFFGKRVVGRMQSAWVTYPLIALLVGGAAWWWGAASTGQVARVNQVELVDIDCATGEERGVLWAQAFSPRADLYNLACTPIDQAAKPAPAAEGCLTWLGLPGQGLGGMQTPAGSLLGGDREYGLSPTLDGLRSAPINLRASKAMVARWQCVDQPGMLFELSTTNSGLVEGVVENQTELAFHDVRLIVNGWAWRLADLPPGGVLSVDAGRAPAKLRTLALNDFGVKHPRGGAAWGSASNLTVDALLHLMMFHEELAGENMPLGSRYQTFCDLSNALAVGRPILLGRTDQPRAQLQRDGEPLDPQVESHGVYYRFVGPPIEREE